MSAPSVAPSRPERALAKAAVSAWAVHVPGAAAARGLGLGEDSEAVPPERAHELLGRKGLLAKEPATRLALCAVHRALRLPPGPPPRDSAPDPRTAVVASSNLGNVETVTRVARTVRERSGREVSPLDAPNASSNVVASTVAIWFGFGGPNLMVCSGATAGLDAVALAALLLRAGRADRVVVVGTEPDDEVAAALSSARRGRRTPGPARSGAAALVVEPGAGGAGGDPRAPVIDPVRSARTAGEVDDGAPVLVGPRHLGDGDRLTVDVEAELGDLYGALGVAQLAVAAALLTGRGGGAHAASVVCGDDVDGWRGVRVSVQRTGSPDR